MGSFTTNIECRFGGYKGRPFLKGDILILDDFEKTGGRSFPPELIPRITPHHNLRIVPGPETDYLTPRSIETTTGPDNRQRFTVSTTLNRTGIRLEGSPLNSGTM
jgi:allophanate hydrolase subunit 2